ncbi:MAG: hypothetical protein E6J01_13525 [Chloroflexi bacterium]|nr:MAG: hypothetical protein E6J01_13525 [Chloroflexota bacterium]
MPARRLSPSVVGYISERLVEVYAILSSGGKLTSFKPGVDVDHRDLIFDERGRNRNVYAQVKCALAAGRPGLFEFNAYYPKGDLPSSPRFVYILCHLDVTRMAITHVWLVPSADFNRLASHSIYRGGIHLVASPGLNRHSKWNPWLIPLNELGPRLLDVAQHAPAAEPLDLPGALLLLAGR